ncbi:MAG: hypothetical protein V4473_01305 [Patescibacteria group bacterium]
MFKIAIGTGFYDKQGQPQEVYKFVEIPFEVLQTAGSCAILVGGKMRRFELEGTNTWVELGEGIKGFLVFDGHCEVTYAEEKMEFNESLKKEWDPVKW